MENKKYAMKIFIEVGRRPLQQTVEEINKAVHILEQEHGGNHALEFEIHINA